jgi:SHS2 domain-containing protein
MPWRELPHTADLRLEITAADWPQLLREATLALAAQLGEPDRAAPPVARPLRIEALDREELLVRWLNEALVWCELEGLLPVDATVTPIGDAGAVGVMTLQPVRKRHVTIKATTYHGLAIEPTADGLVVRILFDT